MNASQTEEIIQVLRAYREELPRAVYVGMCLRFMDVCRKGKFNFKEDKFLKRCGIG